MAAARITLATSRGCDTITAWLAPGTEVVFASIRSAIQRSSSGLMIPSASATTYQDGCSRHAAGPDLNGKRAASAGPLNDRHDASFNRIDVLGEQSRKLVLR